MQDATPRQQRRFSLKFSQFFGCAGVTTLSEKTYLSFLGAGKALALGSKRYAIGRIGQRRPSPQVNAESS
jgi:hypothetical protein